MQRNYQPVYSCFPNNQELIKQTAFHEAGHAVGIYLGNKQKQLPPVFFQIQIKQSTQQDSLFSAKVVDGQLIQHLPIAGLDVMQLTKQEHLSYQSAYEADVINLLIGPLAESKYISIRDNEAFSFNLLTTHALNYYGGSSDLEKAYTYLEYFIPSKSLREDKMLELFTQAFQFINNHKNWLCILNLAHYILDSEQYTISCEEVAEVIGI